MNKKREVGYNYGEGWTEKRERKKKKTKRGVKRNKIMKYDRLNEKERG